MEHLLLWVGFNLFILLLLALDLGVFERRPHAIRIREALALTCFWVVLALLFNLVVYFWRGQRIALQFLTAYLVEKSLSVDNIFVFLLIFSYFAVPTKFQHRILFWGIVAALAMRGLFIVAGVALLRQFAWLTYVFGVFLLVLAVKLAAGKERQIHPERNPVLTILRRFLPVSRPLEEGRFFVRQDGRRLVTPLFVVLVVVETTDVVFAVDSVPAVLAISNDPFIVYSSNVFAILGLRALYFALAGIMGRFHRLHYGLSVILAFIGVKMLLARHYEMPEVLALGVIVVILVVSVVASILRPLEKPAASPSPAHEGPSG